MHQLNILCKPLRGHIAPPTVCILNWIGEEEGEDEYKLAVVPIRIHIHTFTYTHSYSHTRTCKHTTHAHTHLDCYGFNDPALGERESVTHDVGPLKEPDVPEEEGEEGGEEEGEDEGEGEGEGEGGR